MNRDKVIQSQRLKLIAPKWEHFEILFEGCFSQFDVMQFLVGKELSKDEAKEFFSSNFIGSGEYKVLILKDSNEIIGFGGIVEFEFKELVGFELGYVLMQKFWGRGYGIEIAKAQLDLILSLKEKPFATVHPKNLASHRILSKIGMKRVVRQIEFKGRGLRDIYSFCR